ncbi:MAG: hypothetical protein QOI57_3341 [Rubrobacteraceae bacterium]|jgi:hypothetical protein|nr:hypothetical protein [Rubrobacteraceae bacterium]
MNPSEFLVTGATCSGPKIGGVPQRGSSASTSSTTSVMRTPLPLLSSSLSSSAAAFSFVSSSAAIRRGAASSQRLRQRCAPPGHGRCSEAWLSEYYWRPW